MNGQLPRNRSINGPVGISTVYVSAKICDGPRELHAGICIQIRRDHIVVKRTFVRSQLHAVRDRIYHRQRFGLVYITATQIQFDAIPDDLVFGIGGAVVLLVPSADIVRCFLDDRTHLFVNAVPGFLPDIIDVNLCAVHEIPCGIVRHIRRVCHRWNAVDGVAQDAQIPTARPAKL